MEESQRKRKVWTESGCRSSVLNLANEKLKLLQIQINFQETNSSSALKINQLNIRSVWYLKQVRTEPQIADEHLQNIPYLIVKLVCVYEIASRIYPQNEH